MTDLNSRIQYDKEGNKLNPLKLDGLNSTDSKVLAATLNKLQENATTAREYFKIGEFYMDSGYWLNQKLP